MKEVVSPIIPMLAAAQRKRDGAEHNDTRRGAAGHAQEMQSVPHPTADKTASSFSSFYVDGMSCSGCAQKLQDRIASVQGVLTTSVDFVTSRVTVVFDLPNRTTVMERVLHVVENEMHYLIAGYVPDEHDTAHSDTPNTHTGNLPRAVSPADASRAEGNSRRASGRGSYVKTVLTRIKETLTGAKCHDVVEVSHTDTNSNSSSSNNNNHNNNNRSDSSRTHTLARSPGTTVNETRRTYRAATGSPRGGDLIGAHDSDPGLVSSLSCAAPSPSNASKVVTLPAHASNDKPAPLTAAVEHNSVHTTHRPATIQTTHFLIEGMSCSSCAARIETVLRRIHGVQDAAVNFTTMSGKVVYQDRHTSARRLCVAMQEMGYGTSVLRSETVSLDAADWDSSGAGGQEGERGGGHARVSYDGHPTSNSPGATRSRSYNNNNNNNNNNNYNTNTTPSTIHVNNNVGRSDMLPSRPRYDATGGRLRTTHMGASGVAALSSAPMQHMRFDARAENGEPMCNEEKDLPYAIRQLRTPPFNAPINSNNNNNNMDGTGYAHTSDYAAATAASAARMGREVGQAYRDTDDAQANADAAAAMGRTCAALERTHELAQLRMRVLLSAILSLPLVAVMITMSVSDVLHEDAHLARVVDGLQALVATPIVFVLGCGFFTRAWHSFRYGGVCTMDTLVALGIGVSYAYSCVVWLVAVATNYTEHHDAAEKGGHTHNHSVSMTYFDTAGMLTTFMLLGRLLEAQAKRSTNGALISLMHLAPSTALLLVQPGTFHPDENSDNDKDDREGHGASKRSAKKNVKETDSMHVTHNQITSREEDEEGRVHNTSASACAAAAAAETNDTDNTLNQSFWMTAATRTVPASSIAVGEMVRVRPGDRVAVDGHIVAGFSDVDEQLVTGELMPRTVRPGDRVVGGTLNLTGPLVVQAEQVGAATMLSQMVRVVQDAQSSKPAIQRVADRVAMYFVPAVITFSLLTLLVWMVLGAFELYPRRWLMTSATSSALEGLQRTGTTAAASTAAASSSSSSLRHIVSYARVGGVRAKSDERVVAETLSHAVRRASTPASTWASSTQTPAATAMSLASSYLAATRMWMRRNVFVTRDVSEKDAQTAAVMAYATYANYSASASAASNIPAAILSSPTHPPAASLASSSPTTVSLHRAGGEASALHRSTDTQDEALYKNHDYEKDDSEAETYTHQTQVNHAQTAAHDRVETSADVDRDDRTHSVSWVGFAFNFFIATVVAACPCAFGLATPTAIMVGTGVGARHGILVRSGATLEAVRRVSCVVLDKTGTLTRGEMRVVRQGYDEADDEDEEEEEQMDINATGAKAESHDSKGIAVTSSTSQPSASHAPTLVWPDAAIVEMSQITHRKKEKVTTTTTATASTAADHSTNATTVEKEVAAAKLMLGKADDSPSSVCGPLNPSACEPSEPRVGSRRVRALVAAVERLSSHPIARAVVTACEPAAAAAAAAASPETAMRRAREAADGAVTVLSVTTHHGMGVEAVVCMRGDDGSVGEDVCIAPADVVQMNGVAVDAESTHAPNSASAMDGVVNDTNGDIHDIYNESDASITGDHNDPTRDVRQEDVIQRDGNANEEKVDKDGQRGSRPRNARTSSHSHSQSPSRRDACDYHVLVGSEELMSRFGVHIGSAVSAMLAHNHSAGHTTVVGAVDRVARIVFALADEVKPEAHGVVAFCRHRLHTRVLMVTGDHRAVAVAVARRVGMDLAQVHAAALPMNKVSIIRELQHRGECVMFVGDGVNDGPALTQADVGVALGAGTEIAIEAADAVLMRNSLVDLLNLHALSVNVVRHIYGNFIWAFVYNMVMLPVASGMLFAVVQRQLPPVLAGAAMVVSSLSVLLSSLSIRLFKPFRAEQFIEHTEW